MRESRLTPQQWIRTMIIATVLSVVLSTVYAVVMGMQDTTIRIYHTNDIHGCAAEVLDDAGVPTNIGYARAKAYIDAQPAENKLIIDAGDVLSGQPFAEAAAGESMARLVQAMGTDILVPGDGDFDYGTDRLLELQEQYELPIYSENLKMNGANLFDGYVVKKYGQVKVGIFGITNLENAQDVSSGTAQEILMSAADRVYALKKQKCSVIIAVTHLGDKSDLEPNSVQLAQLLPDIDIIIDGHSHSVLENYQVGETHIVSTGENFENLGAITIQLKGKIIKDINTDLIPAADFADIEPDAEIAALIAQMQ